MYHSPRPTPRSILLSMGLLAVFVAGVLDGPAHADTPARGDRYAAIALDESTNAYGYSYNYDTREKAERAAIRRAGKEARIVLSTTRYFFAFAQAPSGAWGTGAGNTAKAARELALRNARKRSVFPEIKFCEFNGIKN